MLLERDHELEVLHGLLDEIETSGGKVVLIRGEAGIGKSALVRELAESRSQAAHYLIGWCDDLSIPEPLGPIWDLARTTPDLAEPLRAGDRMALVDSLLGLLSRPSPTVLVLEDTHWADEATLDLVKYVGRRIVPTNALLLLTYRDGEVDIDHPLRHVIGELQPGSIERLHLEPFSKPAIASLIDTSVFDVDSIFDLTAGNPLFVNEVLDAVPASVPASVHDSVLGRASKLSKGARDLLELVAIAPGGIEPQLLADLLDPSPDLLAECTRQGLLQADESTISFRHELARQAVEAALDPARRRLLNQQVVDSMGPEGNPSRLVHHSVQAGDIASIVEFAPRAARSALDLGSLREALAHFRTLQPYLDRLPDRERAAIMQEWARSEFYLDNPGSVGILEQAIELHRALADDVALARALTFAVRVNEVNGRPDAAEACAHEALKILESRPPEPELAAALSHRGWLASMRWDEDAAIEFASRAFDVARDAGDELSMIQALITKGGLAYGRGRPEGLAMIEEAHARAVRGRYRFEEARALVQINAAAMQHLHLDLAEDAARRGMATAARYEIQVVEAFGKVQLAEVLLARGDWVAAEDLATEGLDTHAHSRVFARWVLGRIQTRTGRPVARQTVLQTWIDAEESGELQNLLPAGAVVAEYMWLTGDHSLGLTDRLIEVLGLAKGPVSASARGDLAWWLWECGVLAAVPDDVLVPYVMAAQGDAYGAAAEWARLGLPYEQAIALGHSDAAGRLEALEILETLGATAVAAKMRQGMRADGINVPRGRSRATRDHSAGLTARQAEVLQLLAEGLSNAEIADRLFVSPRTVENHVSAVMTKLDASTRDKAVSKARRLGIALG